MERCGKTKGMVCALLWALLSLRAEAAVQTPWTRSYLVDQPAYAGMQFYVYKPANIPAGWYATYDGYPVLKGKDGVWVYGTREGTGVTQTGYVVGSVVPSVAGLNPWTAVVPVLSDTPARAAPTSAVPVTSPAQAQYVPPTSPSPSAPIVLQGEPTRLPAWARSAAFFAVERWRGSVDRIGVLNRPSIPVAWKGERPKVIYAWTGNSWYQIASKGEGGDPVLALRAQIYDLTVRTNRSNTVPLGSGDIALLARYAGMWGYRWMGQIVLVDQYGNPAGPYVY